MLEKTTVFVLKLELTSHLSTLTDIHGIFETLKAAAQSAELIMRGSTQNWVEHPFNCECGKIGYDPIPYCPIRCVPDSHEHRYWAAIDRSKEIWCRLLTITPMDVRKEIPA
jgi:hypothetical protein